MPLTLRVDGERWRAHLRATTEAHPRIVPVAKGNGYGFSVGRLARRAAWLGVDTVAVGRYEEADEVLSRFPGDVLVMVPWRPGLPDGPGGTDGRRVVHTLSRTTDLQLLSDRRPGARVVVEGITAMSRHGLTVPELDTAARAARGLHVEGLALHLPMAGDRLAEVATWCSALTGSGLDTSTVLVSHLAHSDVGALQPRWPALTLRPRIGTELWLGDRSALHPSATVLDVHRVRRGQRIGYRQRPMPRAGWLLVLAGGTAHGVGLAAPSAGTSLRSRGISLARGGLDAAGLALSPFSISGKQRWFAEPPHMQVSLVFVPQHVTVPSIGDEVSVDVRFTATTFDAVVVS